MDYSKTILDLIGNTPLVQLSEDSNGQEPLILGKLEFLNPGGSVKDRIGKYIIEKAMAEGQLKPGDTIIDNTSGNTGIGVAMVATAYGLNCIFTCSDKVSQEKIDLLRALGAEVIVTPAEAAWDDPAGCFQTANRLARENGYFYFNQYHNPDNIMAHYTSTGPEIWKQTEGKITHFVGGIGTGGTVSGTARYLKEQNPDIRVIAVDPPGSLFAEYIRTGKIVETASYLVEGIGSDMVTTALDCSAIDEVITVSDEDSFNMTRLLTRKLGILAGGSSGSAAHAAFELAADLTATDVVVVILADSAIRYLSKCFSDQWMTAHGIAIREVTQV